MKTIHLIADGKPHAIIVPDEPKSWAERHRYVYDEEWDGQRDLWNALPWVIGWVVLVLVAVVVVVWVTHG